VKNKNKDIVLLITGCISPDSFVPVLALKDPVERRRQYIKSIKYYIQNTFFKNIVYCDNSGAVADEELKFLADKYQKNFEWLSFVGDSKKCIDCGKGYGEGEIVNYALEHSSIMSQCSFMIKITGRLKVTNLELLLRFAAMDKVQFLPNKTMDRRHYINTRIYMMPIEVYRQCFKDAYLLVDDEKGVFMEHAFGICSDKNAIKYKKFIVCPRIVGGSGSTGRVYQTDLAEHIKNTLKMYLYRR